jgi:fructose/tagatose bisphosphate aldolase
MRHLDELALALALAPEAERPDHAKALRREAERAGVWPASIAPVYRALAEERIDPLTVPAMNVRGLSYRVARAAWRTAVRTAAGPIIFELAPSEAWAGDQSFAEFAAMVLAAAAREGVRGPVFLQADHVSLEDDGPESVRQAHDHIESALEAGFRQIDVDAAALARPSTDAAERQEDNARVTCEVARSIHQRAPDAVVGGEVGEIGGADTTPEDLRAFLAAVRACGCDGEGWLGKVSVQTGTRHGGVVLADGSSGRMRMDPTLARTLADVARREFGLPGVVQHGASTLEPDQWAQLPAAGVIEVHLATGLQNVVLDHPALPAELVARMRHELAGPVAHAERGSDSEEPLTAQQVYAHNRWRAWGVFKRDLWQLPEAVLAHLDVALEAWFETTFSALGVAGRRDALRLVEPPV